MLLGHVNKSSVSCEIGLPEGLFMWFSNKSRESPQTISKRLYEPHRASGRVLYDHRWSINLKTLFYWQNGRKEEHLMTRVKALSAYKMAKRIYCM